MLFSEIGFQSEIGISDQFEATQGQGSKKEQAKVKFNEIYSFR